MISDSDKLDLLYKRSIYGVTKTADAASKSGSNETILSPQAIFDMNIWTYASAIPSLAPSIDTDIVACHVKDKAIKLTDDPTSPSNMTWVSSVKDIIPAMFGTTYAVRLWIGDPNTTDCARLYPDTVGEEWILDASAGVILFPNATPTTKKTSVGSVALADDGLFLEAYAYIGPKGFPVVATGPLNEVDVGPGFAKDTPLGMLLPGSRIASIMVTVKTAFDGGAYLTVGSQSSDDCYMAADHSDLASTGSYLVTFPALDGDHSIVVSLDGDATVGFATVRLTYS